MEGKPLSVFAIILVCLLGAFLLFLLMLLVSALAVNTKKVYLKESPYYRFLALLLCRIILFVLHVRVHISGKEIVPPSGRFVLVSNHRANIDPMVQMLALKDRPLAYISKEENFHIPLIGRIIRRCCFLSIDRNDIGKSMRVFMTASSLIKNDTVSIGVYPEGTRNKTDSTLLPFHNAVFLVAKGGNVPVVVCSLEGTAQAGHFSPFHAHDVEIHFLAVLPASYVQTHSQAEIGDKVRQTLLLWLGTEPNKPAAEPTKYQASNLDTTSFVCPVPENNITKKEDDQIGSIY